MTQEDKNLLLKDLCARLPYNVSVHIYGINVCDYYNYLCEDYLAKFRVNSIILKPYLRPMSSMTEEEKRHVSKMMCLKTYGNGVVYDIPYDVYTPYYVMEDCLNYLRSIHVDYSGLIEKGLAIKAPEGMYNNQK